MKYRPSCMLYQYVFTGTDIGPPLHIAANFNYLFGCSVVTLFDFVNRFVVFAAKDATHSMGGSIFSLKVVLVVQGISPSN